MIERLLAEITNNRAKLDTKMDSLAYRMDVNEASQEQMETEIGSLATGTDTNPEEMEACHRKMEASMQVHSIRSGLEEPSGGRRPGVCRPKDAGPPKGTNEKSDEMQAEVKAVVTSHSTQAKRLLGTIADTRKELHEELDRTIQVETQTTRAVVEIT